jgi:predicted amidophosphoribosyltransferase
MTTNKRTIKTTNKPNKHLCVHCKKPMEEMTNDDNICWGCGWFWRKDGRY